MCIKMQIIIWYMKSILLETLGMNLQIVYNSILGPKPFEILTVSVSAI